MAAPETVKVVNLTDSKDKKSQNVDIFNASLAPGETISVPKRLVTDKLLRLEKAGLLAIGKKSVRRAMTKDEAKEFLKRAAERKEARAAARAASPPPAVRAGLILTDEPIKASKRPVPPLSSFLGDDASLDKRKKKG